MPALRDPFSGRFLPAYITAVRFKTRGEVVDADGNRIEVEEIRDGILRAFRDPKHATSDERLWLEMLRATHSGQSFGAALDDGDIEVLTRWLHDPEAISDSRRIRIAEILGFPRGGGPAVPWSISLRDVRILRPGSVRQRISHDGFALVTKDTVLTASDERRVRNRWLVTEDPDTYMIMGTGSYRRVAPLDAWRKIDASLPSDPEACATLLLEFGRQMGVRLAQTPAQTMWRLLGLFQTGPWRALPHGLCAEACNSDSGYVIGGPTLLGEVLTWIYDMNHAYTAWFRLWPNLHHGAWAAVTAYAGPYGIYVHSWRSLRGDAMGVVSGQAIEEGRGTYPWDDIRRSIIRGWAFRADDPKGDSPMLRFADICVGYDGPGKGIAKRAPVLVVGKSKSAFYDGEVSWGAMSYYPVLWANVVGALKVRMMMMAQMYQPHMAYIDCLHIRRPLPKTIIGRGVGQWKLLDQGPTVYSALGNWKSPHLPARHQGRKEAAPCVERISASATPTPRDGSPRNGETNTEGG